MEALFSSFTRVRRRRVAQAADRQIPKCVRRRRVRRVRSVRRYRPF